MSTTSLTAKTQHDDLTPNEHSALHLVTSADIVDWLLSMEPTRLDRLTQHDCVGWLRHSELVLGNELSPAVRVAFDASCARVAKLLSRALSGEMPEPRPAPNRHWRERDSSILTNHVPRQTRMR